MTDKEVLKQKAAPVIQLLNACPYGEPIPSDWKAPEEFNFEKFSVHNIPIEHLSSKENPNGKTVFQIHGGGFLYPYLDAYREVACSYSKAAGGADVYSLDYRVAPKDKYPAALDDCVAVYQWLLEHKTEANDLIIVGDSAGGNLVLALTLKIKDMGIPLPKAVIALSPWACLDSEYGTKKTQCDSDIILGTTGVKIGKVVFDTDFYIDKEDYKKPYVSPVYGNYEGFPDLLLQAGGVELLLGDVQGVAKSAREAGVNCQFTVYEGMSHDFQLFLSDIEESQQAWKELSEFMVKEFK